MSGEASDFLEDSTNTFDFGSVDFSANSFKELFDDHVKTSGKFIEGIGDELDSAFDEPGFIVGEKGFGFSDILNYGKAFSDDGIQGFADKVTSDLRDFFDAPTSIKDTEQMKAKSTDTLFELSDGEKLNQRPTGKFSAGNQDDIINAGAQNIRVANDISGTLDDVLKTPDISLPHRADFSSLFFTVEDLPQ